MPPFRGLSSTPKIGLGIEPKCGGESFAHHLSIGSVIMAPKHVTKDVSIDLRKEAGGTVFVKDKEGRPVESDWSVLDGKTVGEMGTFTIPGLAWRDRGDLCMHAHPRMGMTA